MFCSLLKIPIIYILLSLASPSIIIISISKKDNQTSVSDAVREIPSLGSTDNAGNSVNLVSDIICLPSGWAFSV